MLRYRTLCCLAAMLLCGFTALQAQTAPPLNAAEIRLQMKKLNTLGSVLYMAAHPDDENTRLLGYLAQESLYRTGYLSLTRGDGGQNLIGNEQAELLGLIRTQELLAARRIDGAEQFFTRANDFGFSKNPEETFTIWDRKKVLGDAVWVIRKFRPDVIICRFPADSRAGHGHHTASAMLAAEAFAAAADPAQFPEQLDKVEPWQVKRLLWNTYNFGGNNTTSNDQFKLDVGAYNALLGKGFGEIAAESRSQHKSQGFGVASSRGSSLEYFSTIKGDAPVHSLLDGVNTSWARVDGGDEIGRLIQNALIAYNMDDPAASVPALVDIRKKIRALPDGYWKTVKLQETDKLILACAGIWMEAFTRQGEIVPGESVETDLQFINRSRVPVTLKKISINGEDVGEEHLLPFNRFESIRKTVTVPQRTAISQPYWLQHPHPPGTYIINDPQLTGNPENIPSLRATFFLETGGETISVTRPLIYKFTDPVKGEVYRSLVIAPPVVASLDNQVFIFTQAAPQAVPVKIRSMKGNVSGAVRLQLPAGFRADKASIPYALEGKGDETEVVFQVSPVKINGQNIVDTLTVVTTANGREYTNSITTIQYDHIPSITIFPSASARLVTVDLKHNGRRIGYISGAGDKVAESLRQVGYMVTWLGEKEIMSGDLSQYDAIITGVRAYNTQPRLRYWQPRLLEYVKNGGVLLIQYNTSGGLVTDQMGPFPFSLSRDRVTNEFAPVKFLLPKDSLFSYPNTITQKDFAGWIQERGLYFPSQADKSYRKPFEMNDPGERPLDGSTIIANYGKGKYIYTGLAFFRQLPAGVPGAYRLFVNMISK
ncbi:PIG-L family deacetylase [Chitinophaga sp. XS-30]|uniref:PIG-L family deacetylase n=1 Tax=Chitinophaga sp. XS-30 TaxID=2604421 RepID=UPI0011DDDD17|nr:PIG-L family deacetylase [Chitinophaga sp. XS-30]QEH42374.1 PIG-L family deacetylase [Chitinophaga sp. XS-30]